MLKFFRVIGTEDKVVWQLENRFILMVDGRTEYTMRMANLPPPMNWMPALFAESMHSARDVVSASRTTVLAMRLTEEEVTRLDVENTLSFLRRTGNTEGFINSFWAFTCMSIMNVPLELCSAGALMRFYSRLIGHRHYEVGFPDGGLGDTLAPAAQTMVEEHAGWQVAEEIVADLGAAERLVVPQKKPEGLAGLVSRFPRLSHLRLRSGS